MKEKIINETREMINKITEALLNNHLKERGVDTNVFHFGICERDEETHTLYCTQIKKHFHLGLYYSSEPWCGVRIEKLIDMDLLDESDDEIKNYMINQVERDISDGKFDHYIGIEKHHVMIPDDERRTNPEILDALYSICYPDNDRKEVK